MSCMEKLKCPKCKQVTDENGDKCDCGVEMKRIKIHELTPKSIITEFNPIKIKRGRG